MLDGHYERHLRRMNTQYAERLDALQTAMHRHCSDALKLRPVTTGLHAVADLQDANAQTVFEEAFSLGIEAMPLNAYYSARRRLTSNALVLGFGGVPPRVVTESVKRLALAIGAAKGR